MYYISLVLYFIGAPFYWCSILLVLHFTVPLFHGCSISPISLVLLVLDFTGAWFHWTLILLMIDFTGACFNWCSISSWTFSNLLSINYCLGKCTGIDIHFNNQFFKFASIFRIEKIYFNREKNQESDIKDILQKHCDLCVKLHMHFYWTSTNANKLSTGPHWIQL